MKKDWLSLLILLMISCSLEEEVVDEVSGIGLLDQPGAELNVIAPAYAQIHWSYLKLRSTVWGINELTADDLIIPCRRLGDWCDLPNGPDQILHEHSWTSNNTRLLDNWQNLEIAVARANTGLFLLQDQIEGDPVLNEQLQAELRFLRAFYRYWQLDFYRQVPFRSERDLDFGTPPPVLDAQQAFQWLEEELLAVIPALRDKDDIPRGRIHRDIARMLLAKVYLNAAVYTGTAQWEKALQFCNEIIETGRYALGADYFALFSQQNQFNNPEAIWIIPQNEQFGFNTWQGPAFDLHYKHTLGIDAFTLNGYCVGSQFLGRWDTTDSRYSDERIRDVTGINLGFLTGLQFQPDGTPVLEDERTDSNGNFLQLDYTPQISTLRGAFRHEGARVVKYEPFLAANNLFPIGPADYLIYRYADVHLMKAEVLFRLGQTGEALAMVNELRMLRGVPKLQELSAGDLLRERGFELYREGHRRPDLIRFGRFTEPWDFKAQSEEFRNVFPIPEAAMEVNPNLKQNAGYD